MKKKTLLIIICAVVAVALIAGGTIFFLSKGFKPGSNSPSDSSEISETVNNENSANTDDNTTDNKKGSEDKKDKGNTTDKTSGNKDNSNQKDNSNYIDTKVPENAAFYIENTSASIGKTVKVPVKIAKNPGFMAFIINFEYDTSALKYKGYKSGNVLSNYEIEDENGKIKFMNIENNDVNKNGTIVYLEFDVIAKKAQKSEIKVVVPDKSIANFNEEYVNIGAQNGYVEIK